MRIEEYSRWATWPIRTIFRLEETAAGAYVLLRRVSQRGPREYGDAAARRRKYSKTRLRGLVARCASRFGCG